MSKIYQPFIIEESNRIVESLEESGFFDEYQLSNKSFAVEVFCEKLTEKFIQGTLEENEIFEQEEFTKCLQEIIAGTLLYELKDKGLINSYKDDETEEVFFLTTEGREYVKKLKTEEIDDIPFLNEDGKEKLKKLKTTNKKK